MMRELNVISSQGRGGGADGRDEAPVGLPVASVAALPPLLPAAAARHPSLHQPLQLAPQTEPRSAGITIGGIWPLI